MSAKKASMGSAKDLRTAVIISKDNGYGLTVDTNLLASALEEIGVLTSVVQPGSLRWPNRFFRPTAYDFAFHVERVYPSWVSAGSSNILIPNQERFPERQIGRLKTIDLVMAKTKHACEIFSALGCNTVQTGFDSRDLHDPAIGKDWRKFLHVAGGSTLKGTEDILALWNTHPEWPTLVLIQKEANLEGQRPPNVEVEPGFLSEDRLKVHMNRCGIHLCPSRSEGWGHYIHEALGCEAVVLTTDAPPMNEFVNSHMGGLVESQWNEKRHLGTSYHVNSSALETAIKSLLSADPVELKKKGLLARSLFLERKNSFRERLFKTLDGLKSQGFVGKK